MLPRMGQLQNINALDRFERSSKRNELENIKHTPKTENKFSGPDYAQHVRRDVMRYMNDEGPVYATIMRYVWSMLAQSTHATR